VGAKRERPLISKIFIECDDEGASLLSPGKEYFIALSR
jgi:hypothetical protein